MKDFDNQKADAPPDTAPSINKPKPRTPAAVRDSGHVVSEIASRSNQDADALNASELVHPANAAPLADMLSELQHSHGNIYVQRVVADMNQAKAASESQSTEKEQSLDGGVRAEMESAFGEGFGDVRVHTGSAAEKLNEDLGARAFTRGRDIYFGRGAYDPTSRTGKETLAHELTHVAQHRRKHEGAMAREPEGRPAIEREADEIGKLVASGGSGRVESASDPNAIYMQPRGSSPPQGAQPNQPVSPGPLPQSGPGQAVGQPGGTVQATAEMDAAFSHIFYNASMEDLWASFFVRRDEECPGFLRWIVADRFPRAWADLLAQRPLAMPQDTFLRNYFTAVWWAVRVEFLAQLRQRYRRNASFRRKVQNLRREMNRPINVPPDGAIA